MTTSPPTPGEQLRTQREKLGLDLQELASRTRIRRAYLEALEEDRRDIFPGETYRQGFLRIYAGALGLDPRELCRPDPSPEPDEVPEPPPADVPVPVSSRRIPLIALGFLGAVLAIGAVFWLLPSPSRPGPPVSAPPDPATASLAAPLSASTSLSRPAEPPESPPAETRERVDAPSPGRSVSPEGSVSSAGANVEGGVAESPPGDQTASGEPSASAEIRLLPPDGATLRVEAAGRTGIELILDGWPARHYDLHTGTQLSWRVRQSAHLRIDDPAAVRLRVDEQEIALSGTSEVILSRALDAP